MDLLREQALVEKAKADPKAFGDLYDAYYPRIFGYVLRRTANVQVAEDLTSEVFFAALKNLPRFRWQGIPFSAWLYRIANNETATYFTRGKVAQVHLDDVPESDLGYSSSAEDDVLNAEAELSRYEQYLSLQKTIRNLDIKFQEVIMLRFFENKQMNEISTILGKPEGTVKSLLHRGLEKLRAIMQ